MRNGITKDPEVALSGSGSREAQGVIVTGVTGR